ncbi:FixH family protein [Moritella sp. 24]|uniref:FixH family protein n=1 Tax=Moritella sp. 24 TaxID=2746230 RepID=UPI001BA62C75|nr:FixH family protein [Moritella sp. 24]QUM76550.1 FixH family protein [Moritella sp. 24]
MKSYWYKEPWFWFVIFFPTLAVVAGTSTFVIFQNNQPDMVSEDYYKDGKKINQDLTKYHEALARNITFDLKFENNSAVFSKASGDLVANQALQVSFFHVTLAKHDISVLATASGDGSYRIDIPEDMLEGKWRVRIESFDSKWRVQEYVQYPNTSVIKLDGEQD